MSEDGMIPVGSGDFPIDVPALEESGVYTVRLMKVALSPKLDKRDLMYCALQTEVAEGDYEGYVLMRNYLPLPIAVPESASKAAKFQAQRISVDFERFCQAFKIKSAMPVVKGVNDTEGKALWHEWISQFYGNIGKVTIQNQEFQGRTRSGINDFVL
jgi:hypothetical protein